MTVASGTPDTTPVIQDTGKKAVKPGLPESEIRTRHTQPPRNDDGGDSNVSDRLSIFKCLGQAFGYSSTRALEDRELVAVEIYIFMNCAELDAYIELNKALLLI
ncbi:hypothetical protein Taro_018174 [Colocasia esculenta]|uniref:Uncharacterized protein n=1 Tax=Colocasia esculenta TaxID=4460 RepID=A0A843UYB5_COLES|nr:hypothetical protein [Colocasia esculenta]